jgi:hypothetical protein
MSDLSQSFELATSILMPQIRTKMSDYRKRAVSQREVTKDGMTVFYNYSDAVFDPRNDYIRSVEIDLVCVWLDAIEVDLLTVAVLQDQIVDWAIKAAKDDLEMDCDG